MGGQELAPYHQTVEREGEAGVHWRELREPLLLLHRREQKTRGFVRESWEVVKMADMEDGLGAEHLGLVEECRTFEAQTAEQLAEDTHQGLEGNLGLG